MGSSPVLYVMYGGDVITTTYTTKLRPSGREVINMTHRHVHNLSNKRGGMFGGLIYNPYLCIVGG